MTGARADRATLPAVIERVAFETGVAIAAITGNSRRRGPVRARTAAAWAASELLGVQAKTIAHALGGQERSTVSHALIRAERWRAADPAFRGLTAKLAAFISGDHA